MPSAFPAASRPSRDVGELAERRPQHVAGGEVAGPGGLQARVDRHPLAVALDAGGGQVERLDGRPAPRAQQQRVAVEVAGAPLVGHGQPRAAVRSRGRALDRGGHQQLDALAGQQRAQGLGQLGLGLGQQARRRLHQGHPRAQAAERLAQLQPDRPRPDHEQPLGQLAQDQHVGAREVGCLGEAGDWDHDRLGSGGDHNARSPQRLAVHRHDARVLEARLAGHDAHAGQRLQVGARTGRPLVDDRLHAVDDGAHVHLDPGHPHPVLAGGAHLVGDLGAADERLAGDAAAQGTGAAHPVALDQRDARVGLRRPRGGVHARHAAPDHDQVDARHPA